MVKTGKKVSKNFFLKSHNRLTHSPNAKGVKYD